MGHSLELENIDSTIELSILLRDCGRAFLRVRNCPGFNDGVLEVFGTPDLDEMDSLRGFMAPRLDTLAFFGSCAFTIPGFRKMWNMRRQPRDEGYLHGEEDDAGKINLISGNNITGAVVLEEDKTWFSETSPCSTGTQRGEVPDSC
jgi:hypothetical protein